MKIRPTVIWFLYPNKDYTNRRLEIGYCPKCEKRLVKYVRENTITGNINVEQFSKMKAEKLMEELAAEKEYSSFDLFQNKGLYGFRYGQNKEIKKNGKTVLVQKAVDFYGNKETVKEESIA